MDAGGPSLPDALPGGAAEEGFPGGGARVPPGGGAFPGGDAFPGGGALFGAAVCMMAQAALRE